MGTRRQCSREFKFVAVRLVRERDVAVAQAARDLKVHENVLRKWVPEAAVDPQHAFPGPMRGCAGPEPTAAKSTRCWPARCAKASW